MSGPRELVVVGAGGFGREVIDVVDAINAAAPDPLWDLIGVVDDAPSKANLGRLEKRGTAYLGTVDRHLEASVPAAFVVGIGSPRVRRRIADRFEESGWTPATLIHPSATFGFDVRVGEGAVICAGVRLTTNVGLGRHVHLNPNVTIGHDTGLGSFVSMNPASSVSGDCSIEDEVLIGVAAVVLNQVRVGAGAIVGAAACVVKDVPPGVTVKGVPAT